MFSTKDVTWLVTFKTPRFGVQQMEVTTIFGQKSAERRLIMIAASKGWGDIDEIEIINTVEMVDA